VSDCGCQDCGISECYVAGPVFKIPVLLVAVSINIFIVTSQLSEKHRILLEIK
jgi:hypothetical protein